MRVNCQSYRSALYPGADGRMGPLVRSRQETGVRGQKSNWPRFKSIDCQPGAKLAVENIRTAAIGRLCQGSESMTDPLTRIFAARDRLTYKPRAVVMTFASASVSLSPAMACPARRMRRQTCAEHGARAPRLHR